MKLAYPLAEEALETIKRLTDGRCADNAKPDAIIAVIQKPRPECEQWIKWRPGLSPKEHDEMVLQSALFDLQKAELELQRDVLTLQTEMKELQTQVEDKTQARHSETMKGGESRHSRSMLFSLLIAIVGSASTLLGLAALKYWIGLDLSP